MRDLGAARCTFGQARAQLHNDSVALFAPAVPHLAVRAACMYFESYGRVRVRAPELTVVYYALCALSFFSIVYSILGSHAHLESEEIQFGTASFRLRTHEDDGAEDTSDFAESDYCNSHPCQVRPRHTAGVLVAMTWCATCRLSGPR